MFLPILILPLKVGEPPAERPKPKKKKAKERTGKRKRKKKGDKREQRERERHLEIFRTISILYGAFCLKK